MAMTKAEKAEMEALRRQVELARALCWPSGPRPQSLAAPEPGSSDKVYGWRPVVGRVQGATSITYGIRDAVEPWWTGSSINGSLAGAASQGKAQVFASRLEALQDIRHELTVDYAGRLAALDQAIEQERACPTPLPDFNFKIVQRR